MIAFAEKWDFTFYLRKEHVSDLIEEYLGQSNKNEFHLQCSRITKAINLRETKENNYFESQT